METSKKLLFAGIFGLLLIGYGIKRALQQPPKSPPFSTTRPTKKNVIKNVDASGVLKIKDTIRVGSLVTGTVSTICVEDNEQVTKGQPLATITTLLNSTGLHAAQAKLRSGQAALTYQESHFKRQKMLFDDNHLAGDAFAAEQARLDEARANLDYLESIVAQEQIKFDSQTIRAPQDGVVVAVRISQGEPVTTDLNATVLFEIAPNLQDIRVHLEIDESDVISTKNGQAIEIEVDSHPNKSFEGTLHSVSYACKQKNNAAVYEGLVDLYDDCSILRPGMTAHATIEIAGAKDALSVFNQVFFINKSAVEAVAKNLGYGFKPLAADDKTKKTEFEERTLKHAWVVQNNTFEEREVELGVTDDTVYAIIDGLTESDEVVIDVEQANAMDEIYKKIARR